jgi:hypothetical protein
VHVVLLVKCQSCGATGYAGNHGDPDSAVSCGCCPEDHHHGHASNETNTPCRPVEIQIMPGGAAITPA